MDDKRRISVALYAVVQSQRDRLQLVLTRAFCVQCGWDRTEYVDGKVPARGDASAWWRLLQDIEQRKYHAVVVFQVFGGLEAYCKSYDTHVAVISPDTSARWPSGSWRRVNIRR